MKERTYSSPLRESQARQTREAILDALTALLAGQPADQIATREIAERAGVSQPTVYRYFPDRAALLNGLSERVEALVGSDRAFPETLDQFLQLTNEFFAAPDALADIATAEAVLNADPRRYSRSTRERTVRIQRLVGEEFPELSKRDHRRITALLRSLVTIQTWLRMREEFGMAGTESGPLVTWALETLIREIRAGNFPTSR
jgi:AcrR family transcriptional regulator